MQTYIAQPYGSWRYTIGPLRGPALRPFVEVDQSLRHLEVVEESLLLLYIIINKYSYHLALLLNSHVNYTGLKGM